MSDETTVNISTPKEPERDETTVHVSTEEKYPDRKEEHRTESEPVTSVEVEGDNATVEVEPNS